jgi:hypothetical protein
MADERNKSRQDRLRKALRENLKRRKQQVKGRAVQGAGPGGPQGAPEDEAREGANPKGQAQSEQD